jgi:enamine deaminase RidA (YjgF/YER057c/UK114 family)
LIDTYKTERARAKDVSAAPVHPNTFVNISYLLNLVKMVSFTSLLTTVLVVAGIASAKPVPKSAEVPVVTYLGTQGPILSSGAWTSKGIVYTSGTVPTFNGSIITGGIEEQTVCYLLTNERFLSMLDVSQLDEHS